MAINKKWRKAFSALVHLFKNPYDLAAAFRVFNLLSSASVQKQYAAFKNLPLGQRVIAGNESLVTVLDNVELLKAMPVRSLGEEYSRFLIQTKRSTAQFAKETKGKGEKPSESEFNTYIKWYRDQHDLTHTVTEYERNSFGELTLLWFLHGNFANLGIVAMTIPMTLTQARHKGWRVFPVVFEAYMNGRKAKWYSGLDWPSLLETPLPVVQKDTRTQPPTRYKKFMAELRARK